MPVEHAIRDRGCPLAWCRAAARLHTRATAAHSRGLLLNMVGGFSDGPDLGGDGLSLFYVLVPAGLAALRDAVASA